MFSFFLLIKSVITLLLLRSSPGVVVGAICVLDERYSPPHTSFFEGIFESKRIELEKKTLQNIARINYIVVVFI